MRLLKTITIQFVLYLGIVLVLEGFSYLATGVFDLSFSHMKTFLTIMFFLTLSALIWERPTVKAISETDQNIKAVETWLTHLSAKQVEREGNKFHYQVSYLKCIDRDLTVTIENNEIRVEGVVRLLRSLPDLD